MTFSRRSVRAQREFNQELFTVAGASWGGLADMERENILRNSYISISSLTLRTSSHGRAASYRLFVLTLTQKTNDGGWQETPSECEGRKRDEHADNVEKKENSSYRERRNERTNANDESCRHEGEEWEGCEYPIFLISLPQRQENASHKRGRRRSHTQESYLVSMAMKKKESKPFDSRRRAKAFWGCVKSEENFGAI